MQAEVTNDPPQRPRHAMGNTVVTLLLIATGVLAGTSGLLTQALTAILLLAIIAGIISRGIGRYKQDLEMGLLRAPRSPALAWHRRQLVIRIAFLGAWLSLQIGTLEVLVFFGSEAMLTWIALMVGISVLWIALALVPRRSIKIGGNVGQMIAVIGIAALWTLPLMRAQSAPVAIELPLTDDVAVIQGGPGLLNNHHYILASQRDALDVLVLDQRGLAMDPDDASGEVEAAFGFGRPLLSPVTGKVAAAVDEFPDSGSVDLKHPAGNYVAIEIQPDQYVLLAHLKQGSVSVAVGDTVTAGTPIAALGNSGNSSMPHLHIQVQSKAELMAEGVQTRPIQFRNAQASRDGVTWRSASNLRRGDRIRALR